MKHFLLRDVNTNEIAIMHLLDDNACPNVEANKANAILIRELAPEDLPADKKYRFAWSDNITPTSKIDVDIEKVRAKYLAAVREARKEKFNVLNAQYLQIAVERHEAKNQEARRANTAKSLEVLAKIEALKDLTDALKTANTLEEIEEAYNGCNL